MWAKYITHLPAWSVCRPLVCNFWVEKRIFFLQKRDEMKIVLDPMIQAWNDLLSFLFQKIPNHYLKLSCIPLCEAFLITSPLPDTLYDLPHLPSMCLLHLLHALIPENKGKNKNKSCWAVEKPGPEKTYNCWLMDGTKTCRSRRNSQYRPPRPGRTVWDGKKQLNLKGKMSCSRRGWTSRIQ